jgi:hypothetical protein
MSFCGKSKFFEEKVKGDRQKVEGGRRGIRD